MDTLVIGIDGGEWAIIDSLIDSGRLPNLALLKKEGVSGELSSTIPPVSPLAWNSIQTGTNPGKHGIYDFSSYDNGYRKRSVNSTKRQAVPFWQILNDHEITTGIFKVPFTYPPDEVSGYIVTGFPTPNSVDDFARPNFLTQRVGPVKSLFEDGSLKRSEGLEAFRDDLQQVAEHQSGVFCNLIGSFDTDFGMTVYDGTDRIQHFFWKFFDETHPRYEHDSELGDAIGSYYETVDKGIGRIIEKTPEDCDIIVISDHGFGPLVQDIYVDEWLAQEGFLSWRSSDNTQALEYFLVPAIENSWKLVKWMDLDQRIKSILPGSIIDFGNSIQNQRSREIDWERTEIFFNSLSGQGFIINLEDRFKNGIVPREGYKEIIEDVKESLLTIRHPDTGERLIQNVFKKEDIYNGWAMGDAPDLIAETQTKYTLKGGHSESLIQSSSQKGIERSGDHRQDGVLIAKGPSFRSGQIENCHVTDIAPTILYLHGSPVPASMDGNVIAGLFSGEMPTEDEIDRVNDYGEVDKGVREWSTDEEDELEDRLKNLGYLG